MSPFKKAIAGALAMGLAMAFTELAAGLMLSGPSIIVAVAESVIRHLPDAVADFAIETFGWYGKPTLVLTMVAILIVLGMFLAFRRPLERALAYAVVGAIGAVCAWQDPTSSAAGAVLPSLAGSATGYASLAWLLTTRSSRSRPDSRKTKGPPQRALTRRAFLLVAALTAAASTAGRRLVRRSQLGFPVHLPRPTKFAPLAPVSAQAPNAVPVETACQTFYRVDTLLDPLAIPPSTWHLWVDGLVEKPLSFTWDELITLPTVEYYMTLVCVNNAVGGHLIGNARWQGVPLQTLLDLAHPRPSADFLISRAVDGHTAGCPLEDAARGMVAIAMNGQPLPVGHGFPARLIVPGLYGHVSATKWLERLELTTRDAYVKVASPRDLRAQGSICTQSRIDFPWHHSIHAPGRLTVAGVAWAPTRGISRVQLQIDHGEWNHATLASPINNDSWREWSFDWDATVGAHTLRVRAIDGDGSMQSRDRQRPAQGGATGLHLIKVTITPNVT